MNELITIRLKSFGFSLLGVAITGVLGFLSSADFATLVSTNFGEGAATTLVLLVVTEVVKHLRNLSVLKKFGATKSVQLI